MIDATDPSNARPPRQPDREDHRPDTPDNSVPPPLIIPDNHEYPDYYKRGPTLLASLGDMSWIHQAARERTARQRAGNSTEYIHRWAVKDQHSAQTPIVAKDAQALANTWEQALHRSAAEPEADPVFSPDEILFNAPESGGDDFKYPPVWNGNEPAGCGSCNTDMMPYDQLVGATMLVIKYHLGDDVVVKSDGEHRSGTWSAAMNLYLRTFPERDVPNLDNWPGARGHVK